MYHDNAAMCARKIFARLESGNHRPGEIFDFVDQAAINQLASKKHS